jgi:hypothetical protein
MRGYPEKGEAFQDGSGEGEPGRSESPREQRPCLELTALGANRGTADLGGASR